MIQKLIIVVVVLALGFGAWKYFSERGGPTETAQVASATQTPVTETGNQVAAAQPDSTPPALNAGTSNRQAKQDVTRQAVEQRRAVYNAMAEKLSSTDNVIKRNEFIEDANVRLDAVSSEISRALNGDDGASNNLLTRANECREFNPMTPLDIDTEIAFYSDRFTRRRNVTDEQLAQHRQRLEQTRTAMASRVENCSWRHAGDFPAVRAQVLEQAERGDVLARFYYALLMKPSPYELDYLLETAAWSDNSLRLTMENINNNQTMGYLALSLSHSQGIFTHQDARLAGIWAYLVMTCPMRGPIAQPYLSTLLTNERMEYLSATTVDIGNVWAETVCPQ